MEKKIEREILSYIGQHEGEVGFYHIARRFGLPNAAYDLPVVVENMVKWGFVEVTNIGTGTDERYRLTEKGRLTLSG
jgi:DNA-binding IclR family transcriptional regulator